LRGSGGLRLTAANSRLERSPAEGLWFCRGAISGGILHGVRILGFLQEISDGAAMDKNIVVCCDGTGNEYGDQNSNVLKLYSVLPKSNTRQLTFYDPGVGTLSLPAALTQPVRLASRILGLAFGLGISANIADAYRFLMRAYEPGDRVYLFGFSRGAYTARAVAAMLYKCGLLDRRNDNLVPYAMKIFKYERRPRIYAGFRRTFSRRCAVRFLGIWDTVSSVGWIYDPLTLQFTRRNPIVRTVRHAVSIDERRCFYRQNMWGEPFEGQDVKQVWFAGVHADVGGSYPERESGLAQIALKWMIEEAIQHELLIDSKRYAMVVPGSEEAAAAASPKGDDDQEGEFHAPPDYRGPVHKSLSGLWWIAEYLPKLYYDPQEDYRRKLMIPRGRWRTIPADASLHESVQQRLRDPTLRYCPPNIAAVHPSTLFPR
jgi:hypothetical protein